MATVDTSWYDLIAKGITPQTMVRNDGFFTAISLKEMENVEITCAIPITKISYKIFDGNDATVLENVIPFPEDGVTRIVFKDVIPLEELKPYETEDCRYGMDVTVTHEASGRKSFGAVGCHSGCETGHDRG